MYLGRIVESGLTDALWRDPRHPYTKALIAAAPVADGAGRIPWALPGVPDPSDPPAGCSFHPRCPIARHECAGWTRRRSRRWRSVACCLFALRSSRSESLHEPVRRELPGLWSCERVEFVTSPSRSMTLTSKENDAFVADGKLWHDHRIASLRSRWPADARRP